MAAASISKEDQDFLAQCEEEFKDRFTENDEDFMKVYNSEPTKPPIVENWWVSNNSGRRNDRRFNRRYQPYDHQFSNRDRGHHNRRNHYDRERTAPNRGYNDNRHRRGYY